ncbi:mRNA-binding protein WHI3 [Saccharomyces paradoxus]|uniref:mRNA-binding protein WHI3 n=1 Tax=Saccharomyces paradoxus TaxID=27291 RepID=A0A8B8UYG4_SACPA|nr:Whi3 [Saccharomyces paradoxus]QHS75724.1 Whi3 [Saccharomyces paradoxus]
MQSSVYFDQTGSFASSSDNIVSTTTNTHNISPSHRSSLNLNTSSHPHEMSGRGSASGELYLNDTNSPLAITSMLNTLALGSMPQDIPSSNSNNHDNNIKGNYSLKLSNVPKDITLRECYAIFALAEGVKSIELQKKNSSNIVPASLEDENDIFIIARFELLNLAINYAVILNSKNELFGPSFPSKTTVEIIDDTTKNLVSFPSSAIFNDASRLTKSTSGMKRPSLLSQRSRFSFSDPFSNDSPLTQQQSQQQQQQQQQQQSQQQQQQQHSSQKHSPQQCNQQQTNSSVPLSSQGQVIGLHSNHSHQDLSVEPSIPTSDIGKSFLLRDNTEINEKIWGTSGIPSSINGYMSTPQPSTPTLEWGNTSASQHGSSFFLPSAASTAIAPTNSNTSANANANANNGTSNTGANTVLSASSQQPMMQIGNAMNTSLTSSNSLPPYGLMSSQSQHMSNMVNTSDMNITPQKQNRFMQQPQPEHMYPVNQSSTPQKVPPARLSSSRNSHKNNSTTSLSSNITGSASISQADLSLLARIPPPANPADQNPPCNTLYVGNLPSDATEQELRQLFSGQEGFRRLSFRNKNTTSNGHSHGPMCFVEFDDVSFATRALAELYGRQLPRSTVSSKGGIRLSFSKNPLGVRGPNSRRGGTSNPNPNVNMLSSYNSNVGHIKN